MVDSGVERTAQKSLHTRDWQKAQGIVRELEVDGAIKASLCDHRFPKSDGSEPDVIKSQPVEPQPITVLQAWAEYIADLEKCNLKASAIRKFRLLRHQMEEFTSGRGVTSLKDVASSLLRHFRGDWKDGPLSSTKKLERLRAFFPLRAREQLDQRQCGCKIENPKTRSTPDDAVHA